jgi:2-polyprenyl-3-methyl-5-hydroxy-6-metoxy-1,4-benzoquinol methylase
VASFFERCDWVVLPYRSATGSAVIPLAYHMGRPVIATRVGGLTDVVVQGQTGILVEPDDPQALVQAVRDVLQGRASHDPEAIQAACTGMTWDGLAEAVVRAPAAQYMLRTHVIKDRASRELKARKILNLVIAHRAARLTAILDVGAGAGYIAQSLACLTGATVCAVDVIDERQVTTGYEFTRVSSVVLPYADRAFDLVISNHVIEHVGDRATQLQHLKELARTLGPDGVLYLAVPNRWGLVEPHYRLPFLSWLPQRWADRVLRWTGKGAHYDCRLLSRSELEELVGQAGLTSHNLAMEAMQEISVLENHRIAAVVGHLPSWLVNWFLPWIPTHIYLCRHAANDASTGAD